MRHEVAATIALDGVCREVLSQHEILRMLLREAIEVTTRALKDRGEDRSELDLLVRDLRTRFRAHLCFEEQNLVPLLAQIRGWGEPHLRELHEEHARQRSELDVLIEGIEDGWDVAKLALTLRSLATELFIDMSGEERSLEQPVIPPNGAVARGKVSPGTRAGKTS
jgi:hemerythrin-like domain-containing protein